MVKLKIQPLDPHIDIAFTLILGGYNSEIITAATGPHVRLNMEMNIHDSTMSKIVMWKLMSQKVPTAVKVAISKVKQTEPKINKTFLSKMEMVYTDKQENIKLTTPKITGTKYGVFNSTFSNIVMP